MTIIYWVKFQENHSPERWQRTTFEALWHDLREFMLRNNTGYIEWMIRE